MEGLEKKGEADAVDDADLFGLDANPFDQEANDLAARRPVGLFQSLPHARLELIQAGQRGTKFGLFLLASRELCQFLFVSAHHRQGGGRPRGAAASDRSLLV